MADDFQITWKGNAFLAFRLGFKVTYGEYHTRIQYTLGEQICIDNATLVCYDGNDRERRKRGNAVFPGL